jgi:hypothetical protein
MELTMPSTEHETVKQFLVLIVDTSALAPALPHFVCAGLARVFEPDACFYIQHTEALHAFWT